MANTSILEKDKDNKVCVENLLTLEQACEFIVDCLHNTAPTQESGYPLIRTPNIGKGRFILEGVFRVNDDTYQKWTTRAVPQVGDLILAREAPAGNVAVIKDTEEKFCLGQRTVLLRPNPKLVDSDFLVYFLLTPKQQAKLLASSTGATVKHVNMKDIRKLPLHLPALNKQKKIGSILSAYDDLIENNRRRIALLEQAARLLYQEWFVHFRFPGHEHVRMVDGLPEGWEMKTAFEVMDILSGGTPKTDVADYWNGNIPFFTPKDAKEYPYVLETEKSVTELGLKNCNSRLYSKDTIFITARGTVGKICLAQVPMAMNQSCYALVGKNSLNPFFLYCALKQSVEHYKSRASGAVFDAIVVDTFKRIPFILPAENLITSFSESVIPVFNQMDKLLIQNNRLKEAREILLPRLMNGEIPV